MTSILNVLPIFDDLSESIKITIKCFYVSQNKQSEKFFALFVTNNDQVYGVGDNSLGKLGLGHNNPVNDTTLIHELCNQNICEFFEGFDCIFAKTIDHKIYGLGSNVWGQLTKEYANEWNQYSKPNQIDYFNEKCIVQICCGLRHYLALSSDGLVYGWGRNTFGQVGGPKRDKITLTPIMLDQSYGIKHKIKSIHCSHFGSFAITFDDQVYSWGLNFHGDLGHNNFAIFGNKYIFHPKLMNIRGIMKITTFNDNTHLLDNQGQIFGCGKNYKGYKLGKCKSQNFCDALENVLNSNEFVFEIIDENFLIKTKYFNIWDYFLTKCKITPKTFHLSIDGSVCVRNIKTNEEFIKYQGELGENFLSMDFENIFDGKFEKQFNKIRKIGFGSYGTVFEVQNKLNDRVYAIKTFSTSVINLKKFSEAIILTPKINNDFIVKIINPWVESKNIAFVQMELYLGNLNDILESKAEAFGRKSNERLDSFEYFISCEILREVTQSLNYLHSLKPPIFHSNLKPENILLTDGKNGRFFKISDFGLMAPESSFGPQIRKFNEYTAPEVIDVKMQNQKSDVYSLAIIANKLFEFNFVSHFNDIDECLEKYFNTILVVKCKLLLETLAIMVSEKLEERPNCYDLLISINNWTIDRNKVINMQHYYLTLTKLRQYKDKFFINFIEKKSYF